MYQLVTIGNDTYAVRNTKTGKVLAFAYVNILDALAPSA